MRKPIGKIKSVKRNMEMRRKLSLRKKVAGTPERPRLCVNKTNKHLSVQIIDDVNGTTLFSVKTFGKKAVDAAPNKDGAKKLGEELVKQLKGKAINNLVFDRNGKKYTGVIASLADSIRSSGIEI